MTQTPSWTRFATRSVSFWVAVVLLVVGAILLAVQWGSAVRERRFDQEGRVADGIVLSKNIRRATRSGSNRSQTRYQVTYRFTAADGVTYEGEDDVTTATWDRLQELEPVRIQFLVSSPSTNRLAGQSSGTVTSVAGGIGLIASAIGLVLLVRSANAAKNKARIWATGVSTSGTVTGVEETNVKVNRRPMWVVRYHYRDHAGQTHDGTSDYMSAQKAHAWKAGDNISVRFDPDKPQLSVWVAER